MESSRNVALLEDVIRELGYDVQVPGRLKGRSGVIHSFAMYASRGERYGIAIEVDDPGRPAEISILAFYAKALDAELDRLVLVTDESVSVEAERLARLYSIQIVSSQIPEEEFKQRIEVLLS